MTERRRHLGSTYRIQLNGFGLAATADLVDYLSDLGIETVYLSPVTKASSGSTHGYDVVDPTCLDPALGTMDDLTRLLDRLESCGMRALLDFVPNHMSTSMENAWWRNVLKHGRTSSFAGFFDIDWKAGAGRVVLPVLAKPLTEVLESEELEITASDNEAVLHYGTLLLPLAEESYADLGENLDDVAHALSEDPARLRRLLDLQHYELIYWRDASHLVNYRRFFDINDLVGVRQEEPDVYEATHRFVLGLAADPRIAGLRIDHIDGLADPSNYIARLASDMPERRVLIEKILARDEQLPTTWDVDGTTGYEFADLAFGLLTDRAGAGRISEGADARVFESLEVAARGQILDQSFPGELGRLADRFEMGSAIRSDDLVEAISALTVFMRVYRTYLSTGLSEDDASRIGQAADAARRSLSSTEAELALGTVVDLLLSPEVVSKDADSARIKWQQLSSATAAKGVEDTALYRFPGLLSSADVGSDPGDPSVGVEEFHRAMTSRCASRPDSMNATSTHDSKRSEDVRSRLAVLSEIPDRWIDLKISWRVRYANEIDLPTYLEEALYQGIAGTWPAEGSETGALSKRVKEYIVKAAREAKLDTSWNDPSEAFESKLLRFVGHLLDGPEAAFAGDMDRLVEGVQPAATVNSTAVGLLKITAPGVPDVYQGTEAWKPMLVDPDNRRPVDFAGLRQMLKALPKPGDEHGVADLVDHPIDGRMKTFVLTNALKARRRSGDLFASGQYLPVETRGEHRDDLVAFVRRTSHMASLTVIPRFPVRVAGVGRVPLGDDWKDTELVLPRGLPIQWTDVLSSETLQSTRSILRASEVLSRLPVGLSFSSVE